MAKPGKKSFRRNQQAVGNETDPERVSFWRRLFGGKPVRSDQLTGNRPATAQRDSTIPKRTPTAPLATRGTGTAILRTPVAPDTPPASRPRSFLTRKFNSQAVKSALLEAIAEAQNEPPPECNTLDQAGWSEGLARKIAVVKQLDCSGLEADQHLRAIQWMSQLEKLHPLKATFRGDLVVLKFKLGWVLDKDQEVPDAVTQAGILLRKLDQWLRPRIEGTGKPEGAAGSGSSQPDITALRKLMAQIEELDFRKLDLGQQEKLAGFFRSVDPFSLEFNPRNPQFLQRQTAMLRSLQEIIP